MFKKCTKMVVIAIAILFALSSNNVKAEDIAPVERLSVDAIYGENRFEGAKLQWIYFENNNIEGFKIFSALGIEDDLTKFQEVGDVHSSGKDKEFKYDFLHKFDDANVSSVSYYIVAYKLVNEMIIISQPSEIVSIEMPGIFDFFFICEPVFYATPGEETEFFFEAYYMLDDYNVNYEIWGMPEGATFDTETGIMTWTPTKPGSIKVKVRAYLDGMESKFVQQWFEIIVRNCSELATIEGNVVDNAGNVLEEGVVTLFKLESNTDKMRVYAESRFSEGKYLLENIDEGSYYLMGNSWGMGNDPNSREYYEGYYDNASTFSDATLINIECASSQTADLLLFRKNMNHPDKIYFVSEMMISGTIDETIQHNVLAETANEDDQIKYWIENNEDGATIDEESGLFTFTPERSGQFYFKIKAYVPGSNNLVVYDYIHVWVTKCENPNTLSVSVNDTEGEAIEYGYGILYDISALENQDPNRPDMIYFGEIVQGELIIEGIDEGEYYLYLEAGGRGGFKNEYLPQWWDGAYDMDEATVISFECDESITISATMQIAPQPEHYIVTGYITDEATGNPIKFAMVEFSGIYIGELDFYEGMAVHTMTTTDIDGFYSIELPEDFKWLISASRLNRGQNIDMLPEYGIMYYPGVENPRDAEWLIINEDTQTDLALIAEPVFENKITGYVKNTDGVAISNSKVAIFKLLEDEDDSQWRNKHPRYFGVTDGSGKFVIENIRPGKYVIFAYGNRKDYVPGYYLEGETAVYHWREATVIEIAESGSYGDYLLTLEKHNPEKGEGKIYGRIASDRGKIQSADDVFSDDVLEGANVYAINAQGNIANYAETDADGYFEITDLPYGVYTLKVDMVGYSVFEVTVEVDENNSEASRDMNLDDFVISVSEQLIYSNAIVYPTPANEFVSVAFNAYGETANISLITLDGSIAFQTYSYTGIGTAEIRIETSNLSAGTYILKIETGSKSILKPVLIVR